MMEIYTHSSTAEIGIICKKCGRLTYVEAEIRHQKYEETEFKCEECGHKYKVSATQPFTLMRFNNCQKITY